MTDDTSNQSPGGGSPTTTASELAGPAPRTRLEAGSLSFTEVLMQGVTHIAPAFGLFFSFQFISSLTGVTAPLAYLAGSAIMILIAVSLGSMAKHLPSAGGYFTYVSRALSPRVGFFISWLYVLYSPIAAGLVFGMTGAVSNNYFKSEFGFEIAWYWWVLVGLLVTAAVSYRGIKITGRMLLLTGLIEMAILLALSFTGLGKPGPGGFNFSSFNPGESLSGNGFYLAVVFSIVAYTGWESIGPLAEETANPRTRPLVFSKLTSALTGPYDAISYPFGVTEAVDYEVELAVVIGRPSRDITVAEARRAIAGYVVVNDVSARDWQFADDQQLTLGKGFDAFFPTGPWVTTEDEVPDPQNLRIRCSVDGQVVQDSSTAQMLWGVFELVSWLSRICTLLPGDLVATGTPPGVGMGRVPPTYLRQGQTVTSEIDDLGTLRNTVALPTETVALPTEGA
ncbi:amino acid permease [Nonomuraea lactucae]|uniref:amino acid permease n=1 Tax=Nonomuraea lactucae TaxID=2249762 RepID=UPI000DE3DAF5|nr:amino acid permease [Nonomuraea lactucae]